MGERIFDLFISFELDADMATMQYIVLVCARTFLSSSCNLPVASFFVIWAVFPLYYVAISLNPFEVSPANWTPENRISVVYVH